MNHLLQKPPHTNSLYHLMVTIFIPTILITIQQKITKDRDHFPPPQTIVQILKKKFWREIRNGEHNPSSKLHLHDKKIFVQHFKYKVERWALIWVLDPKIFDKKFVFWVSFVLRGIWIKFRIFESWIKWVIQGGFWIWIKIELKIMKFLE